MSKEKAFSEINYTKTNFSSGEGGIVRKAKGMERKLFKR
jgi:hypothetical protein